LSTKSHYIPIDPDTAHTLTSQPANKTTFGAIPWKSWALCHQWSLCVLGVSCPKVGDWDFTDPRRQPTADFLYFHSTIVAMEPACT